MFHIGIVTTQGKKPVSMAKYPPNMQPQTEMTQIEKLSMAVQQEPFFFLLEVPIPYIRPKKRPI